MAQNIVVDRFLDVGEEPVETLTPIVGYETVDLVSLEEAVKPLEPLLHNLDAMVHTAKRNSRHPADGLTHDESAAIRLYTIQWPKPYPSLFTLLNQRLRSQDRDTLVEWYLYLKLFLTALYKLPSVNNRIIWRGICGNVSDQYDRDQIWWGTSSCTENMRVMGRFVGLEGVRSLFIIECMNGKAIHAHSQYKLENEILLMPGTYLQVVDKWTPSHDLHIIHLREAIPPYQIIAPPINPRLQLTQPTPLANPTISDKLDNASSDSQTTIATQLSEYKNPRLETIITENSNNPELKLVLMDLTDQDMEIVAHFALRNNQV